eukprot:7419086-Pyramimonas_sp.AAC.1
MIIPGSEMYKVLLGKVARVFYLTKTPPGHPAIKVDEYGVAAEDNGSTAFTITANLHREDAPLLVKEAADAGPTARQPASSSAGAPATSDAHAYMVSQDTKGIRFSSNEETFVYTIQSSVNNTLKTWHRRNTTYGNVPTLADQDFALRNLRAKVYQAIYEEGRKWMPPDSAAGTHAG